MWDVVAEWSAAFTSRFVRVESRRQMAAYLRGLLSETERKNGWTLAEAAGDGGPQGMQRLLNFYAWDADGVRDDVRAVVAQALGDAQRGVLIVDETGFVKKGTNRRVWPASTLAPRAGSRIPRSVCSPRTLPLAGAG